MSVLRIFQRDFDRYDGVRPIHIYVLRTFFLLMFVFVSFESWGLVASINPSTNHVKAVAWCMFASYTTLAIVGVFRPLKMLPIMVFMVFYKTTWLLSVAYPLWAAGMLEGSPAAGMARVFAGAPVAALVAIPWKYVFYEYVLNRKMVRPAAARSESVTLNVALTPVVR
jgi:hypothetical protein